MMENDNEGDDAKYGDGPVGFGERMKKECPELYADESLQDMLNTFTVLWNMLSEEKFIEVLEGVDEIIKRHIKKARIENQESSGE